MFKKKAEIKYNVFIPDMDDISTIIYIVDNMYRQEAVTSDYRDVFGSAVDYHSLINARLIQLNKKEIPTNQTKLSKLLTRKKEVFDYLVLVAEIEENQIKLQRIIDDILINEKIQDGPF